MPYYRVYFLHGDDRTGHVRSLECADDDDALLAARVLVGDHDVELWSGHRFVQRVGRDMRPSAAALPTVPFPSEPF
jgi:hypothetical protein